MSRNKIEIGGSNPGDSRSRQPRVVSARAMIALGRLSNLMPQSSLSDEDPHTGSNGDRDSKFLADDGVITGFAMNPVGISVQPHGVASRIGGILSGVKKRYEIDPLSEAKPAIPWTVDKAAPLIYDQLARETDFVRHTAFSNASLLQAGDILINSEPKS